MFLHATRRELRRSFSDNLEASGDCGSPPEALLLVYALESGMKSAIMTERSADHTSQLPMIEEIGHDLRECLKALRAPAKLTIRATSTRQRLRQVVSPTNLHQAFRYGVELEDRDGIVDDLQAVRKWLMERLR